MKSLKTLFTKLASGTKKEHVKEELLSNMLSSTQVSKSKRNGLSYRSANIITESTTTKTEETLKSRTTNGLQSIAQQQTTSRVTLGGTGYKYKPR